MTRAARLATCALDAVLLALVVAWLTIGATAIYRRAAGGASTTTCGGELGKPCGCPAGAGRCVEPCVDCCETVPCPVEGCAR